MFLLHHLYSQEQSIGVTEVNASQLAYFHTEALNHDPQSTSVNGQAVNGPKKDIKYGSWQNSWFSKQCFNLVILASIRPHFNLFTTLVRIELVTPSVVVARGLKLCHQNRAILAIAHTNLHSRVSHKATNIMLSSAA